MKFTKINLNDKELLSSCFYVRHGISDVGNFRKFIKENNIYSGSLGYCYHNEIKSTLTTGRGRFIHGSVIENTPPCYDHGGYYKTKDGQIFLAYQPYGDPSKVELYRAEIEQWATDRGIQAKVFGFDYGWYNSSCYLVVIGLDLSSLKVEKALNVR
ncbi:hypothetical protein [Lactococcus petauri]|uniref:hypothetical protein n=1 Tax=Lactococcus petauri TaxID=1940789 RepID=UPI00254D7FE9|nr:hypothetical protein [Lactococcus petauri]